MICSSDSIPKYQTKSIFDHSYSICKCKKCRAYFLHPKPTSEELKQAYDETYYGCNTTKFDSRFEYFIDIFRKLRARHVSILLGNKGRILDIGCGNGRFLLLLGKTGKFELHGTEVEGNSAKRAAKATNIRLKIGELENEDFEDGYFDGITMYHVYEHLNDPARYIEIIKRKLKSQDLFVISFPKYRQLPKPDI